MLDKPKKIYGPYTMRDGRQTVKLYYGPGKKMETVSYPKYLMEQRLGRKLKDNETIDHKDRNFLNNDPDNLQVLDRVEHYKLDAKRAKLIKTKCVWCDKEFERHPNDLRTSAKKGCAGPFCNTTCSTKYARAIKTGKIKPFPVQPMPKSEYYRKKDLKNDN